MIDVQKVFFLHSVRFNRLTKVYDESTVGLKDVTFEIPSSGIFSLIGRNGAGKTTLIRILATQLLPTSGTVEIDGIDIVGSPNELRERIAIIPQESRALPWLTPFQTILSYLLYRGFSYSEARSRTRDVLTLLELDDLSGKFNRKLSGGQKRKVLVATVIASEADILFLDEPTTGLDPISRQELWGVLESLKRERFIFLTTHYLEEAEKLADRIGILEGGRLFGVGTLDELRSRFQRTFSIRILQETRPLDLPGVHVVKGFNNTAQIIADDAEAYDITRKLIENRIRFSIAPISLEDIFYDLVRKPIGMNGDA